jgi:hypothetical protein
LLNAFDNLDPAPNRQKAITPKFLRVFYRFSGAGETATRDTASAVSATLAILAFFFAMRSCEYSTVPNPGKTKKIDVGHVDFRDKRKRILPANCTIHNAAYVTLPFIDQKNGKKMDVRTQQKTGDPVLCPVIQAHALVSRIRRTVPHYSPSTTLNTLSLAGKTVSISSTYLLQQLRFTCRTCGGTKTFGFPPSDIGTHSLHSGGAMALFLNDHPVHKIMIFGRWSSDAFLVHIRPQVLEWTNNMSCDMIRHDSFLDATDTRRTHREDPRVRQQPFNGPSILMPRLHLFH